MTKNRFVLISLMSISFGLVITFLFLKLDLSLSIPKYLNLKSNDGSSESISFIKSNSFLDKMGKQVESLVNRDLLLQNGNASETMSMYNTILQRPNEFVLKYVNLPYDYKYGSNSIPLAISSLICDGDLLELGMVIAIEFFKINN
jgi:hypothetical protein